ncbi:hypothetical protein BST43_02035 [Mycobacteroides saopaulense]|uniref:DUF3093 domain-containing protein n=1 Tax=Mycobacteroides saopaulense TaxID=1578165 RepID=A0A1S4VWM5_9MYCO|nr:hypothetical protein [Mycobacteroides saopaulense]ALR13066.1 membrane protein [Mycobacteroides saopaulense]ORB60357.1 hypothetical protein BST43_02035 [Mycobacteroides saopaulense]
MADVPNGEPRLFYEPGGRWRWLLLGPLAGLIMFGLQVWGKGGYSLVMPLITAAIVAFFISLQIYAARVHATVELTPTELRQGGETLAVSQIKWLYPEDDRHVWEESRPLGELTGVPKGRKPVGLRLTGGRRAQAWAKKHQELRTALATLVPAPPAGMDLGEDPEIDIESEQW